MTPVASNPDGRSVRFVRSIRLVRSDGIRDAGFVLRLFPREAVLDDLLTRITLIWQSAEARLERPTVLDEVRSVLYVMATGRPTFRAIST